MNRIAIAVAASLSLVAFGCGGGTTSTADTGTATGSDTGGAAQPDTGAAATDDAGTATGADAGTVAGADAGTSRPTLTPTAGTGSLRFYEASSDCNAVVLDVDNSRSYGASDSKTGIKGTVVNVDSSVGKVSVMIWGTVTDGKTYTCDGQKVDGSATIGNTEYIAGKYHYWGASACTVKVIKAGSGKLSLESYGSPMERSSGYDAKGTYTLDVVSNETAVTGL